MNLKVASVQARLGLIADYLNELKPLGSLNMQEIISDPYKYRTAERLQELIIQASLDINRHLLKELHQLEPKENSSVFIESARVGILPPDLGQLLAEAASFRNVLVHLYEKINPEKVIDNIQLILRDYPIFLDCIRDHLDSLGAINDTES